jgi:hypothetical protein
MICGRQGFSALPGGLRPLMNRFSCRVGRGASCKAVVPKIKTNVDQATAAVAAIHSFVDSVNDNPGRRIISVYLGIYRWAANQEH